MKKVICVFLLFVVFHLPISCSHTTCGDYSKTHDTKIDSIKAIVGKYQSSNFTTELKEPHQGSTIRLSVKKTSQVPIKYSFIFPTFINSCFACSPLEPAPTQTITKIAIYSNNKIVTKDKSYPVNNNIANLFEIKEGSFDFSSIEEYLKRKRYPFGSLDEELFFQILEKPSQPIENHDITIELRMDDGAVYKATAKGFNVKINPSTKS